MPDFDDALLATFIQVLRVTSNPGKISLLLNPDQLAPELRR